MFANLSQGNVLYGVELGKEFRLFAAPITQVSAPYAGYINNNGTQVPTMVVDIVATVNGDRQEFKQVPSNISIADFKSFVLADNKESLTAYVDAMIKNSQKVLESMTHHQELVKQYSNVYSELNPAPAPVADNTGFNELKTEFSELKGQFSELITLLKSANKPKIE